MSLINMQRLIDIAASAGFTVREGRDQTELWFPKNDGEKDVYYHGSIYSTADILLSSMPELGYGYNSFFNGPYHRGYVRHDSFGVTKLFDYIQARRFDGLHYAYTLSQKILKECKR